MNKHLLLKSRNIKTAMLDLKGSYCGGGVGEKKTSAVFQDILGVEWENLNMGRTSDHIKELLLGFLIAAKALWLFLGGGGEESRAEVAKKIARA